MKRQVQYFKFIFWLIIISFFTYLMVNIVLPYTSWRDDVDFLLTKSEVVQRVYYMASFYAHIFSSCIILFCGAFLFSNVVLRRFKKLHRYLGRLYVGLVLIVSAPSGLVMAVHANGGIKAQTSFVLLSVLWWLFTYKGFKTAVQGNFIAHRKWMMRSYALTLSAVTLRVMQMILGSYFYLDPVSQYIFVAWGSWMFNLFLIEFYFLIKFLKTTYFNKLPKLRLISFN